jgi:hypothetical protein
VPYFFFRQCNEYENLLVVKQVQARHDLDRDANTQPHRNGSAFCAVRARLPLPLFQKKLGNIGESAC